MKNYLKFICPLLLGTTITTTVTLVSINANSTLPIKYLKINEITNTNNKVGYYGINEFISNNHYNENAFLENAIKVANNDSNLFYVITWGATLHKLSPIAHILKVLELNPQKRISLYITSNLKNIYNLELIKKKYKNFNYKLINNIPDKKLNNYIDCFESIFSSQLLNEIKNNKSKNNILYINDFPTMSTFISMPATTNHYQANNLIKNYYLLTKNFKEINIIPDGTATISLFHDNLYKFYKNKNVLSFNEENNSFDNAIKFLREISKWNISDIKKWILDNEENGMLLLAIIFSGGYKENKDICKINLYVPFTNMIKDINNKSSVPLNINTIYNEYFNPFDIQGLNIIGLIKSMNNIQFELLWNIFKLPNISNLLFEFNNHTNIIYGGGLLENNLILNEEATKIIKLINNHTNEDNLQLWFKAHPREQNNYKNKLIKKVKELSNENIANKIKFLDKSIPFEFLTLTNIMTNDKLNNRVVKFYANYSTLYFTMLANNENIIEKVLVTEKSLQNIIKKYGNLNESLCFNEQSLLII